MISPARRRAVRTYRLLRAWPLWYLAAAVVGVAVCVAGAAAGRPGWVRVGLFLTLPLVGLLGSMATVLAISLVLNMGLRLWKLVARGKKQAR